MAEWILVLALGLAAGTVGGVIGFGTSIMLMPALVWAFGPREAVPILAIASIMANASRVWVWGRDIQWRLGSAYAVGGVPAAALGAHTLLVVPERAIAVFLGLLFLAMVPVRRWMLAQRWRLGTAQLMLAGAGVGYLTGVAASTGPINTPIFLMLGLVKGPFLATEAMASLSVFASKAITFRSMDALPAAALLKGLLIGVAISWGSYLAKSIVQRVSASAFQRLIDLVMLVSGVVMLGLAWRA